MDAFSLGQMLRQARQSRDIALERVEQELKIRRYILEGFEQGNFSVADISQVQVRGFLRNYARYLGLDEDLIIQYYESSLLGDSRRRPRSEPRPQPKRSTQPMAAANARPDSYSAKPPTYNSIERSRRKGRGLLNALLILLVGAAAIGVIAFVVPQILTTSPDTGTATDPAPQVAVGEGLPTLTPTPDAPLLPTGTATLETSILQNYSGEPVLISIEFLQRTWMRVEADGQEVFRGIVRPQELIFEQRANNEVILEVSNAKALVIVYNGQPQPAFGERGQAVRAVFRPENDITVTSGGRSVALLDEDVQAVTAEQTEESTPDAAGLPAADPTASATFQAGVPTPLPVFGQPTVQPSETPADSVTLVTPEALSTLATGGAGITPESTPLATSEPNDVEVTQQPTVTPTPDVPLPPRVTPTGQAPQKPGG